MLNKRLLALSALSLACLSSTASATYLTDLNVPTDQQIIGGNYHGNFNYFDAGVRCIQVDEAKDIEVIHNESASVVTTSTVDYNTLEKELSVGVSAGGTLPTGDPMGLKSNFLKNAKTTNNSIVFTYRTEVVTGSLILKGPYKLTEEGRRSLQAGPQEFERYCGDQFVHQIDKGAKAYVAVKVELESENLKRIIDNELGGSLVDFFELSVHLKMLKDKYGLTGKVTIAGYQEGGFAARINSIFGTGDGMSQCSGSNFAKCEILLKDVVQYFAHDFGEQFDHYYRGGSSGGNVPVPMVQANVVTLPPTAKTLAYTTRSYCKLAISDRPEGLLCADVNTSAPVRAIQEARQNLEAEVARIQALRHEKPSMASDYLSSMNAYETDLIVGTSMADTALMSCIRDAWSCSTSARETIKTLPQVRQGFLDALRSEDRVEICVETGTQSDITAYRVKLLHEDAELSSFKILGEPSISNKSCYKFRAPEALAKEITGVEVQVQPVTQESPKCTARIVNKFGSWADWDLKFVEVTQLDGGRKATFEGKNIERRHHCTDGEKKSQFLPWIKLQRVSDK